MKRIRHRGFAIWTAIVALLLAVLAQGTPPAHVSVAAPAPPTTPGGCQLASVGGNIQHVIYLQFDNVHFTRDNPNIPSDLEQMPNLLNIITNNGIKLANH